MINRIRYALLLTLAGAVAVRVASELLRPVVPVLLVVGALAFIVSLLFQRNGGSS